MTKKIMSEVFINMNRTLCHRTLRVGGFRGAYAVTVRFNDAPDIGGLTSLRGSLVKDAAIAACEIWTAVDPAGQPVSMEEKLRGGDKKIKACLMVDTLRQADAEKLGARLAKQFPGRRCRRVPRAVPVGQWRSLNAIAAADRGKNRRRLIERKETIAIAESSTGGLIAAALLAVPGASAYFVGGAVVYTKAARLALLGISDDEMKGMRASTEAYALLCARRIRDRHGATWGLGETGATGPTGNRYGDAAGHTCMASPVRPSGRLPWKPAVPTGGRIWMPSPSARSSFCWKRYRPRIERYSAASAISERNGRAIRRSA